MALSFVFLRLNVMYQVYKKVACICEPRLALSATLKRYLANKDDASKINKI
jgi:hypothetical protein